jgi:hypothetical protein
VLILTFGLIFASFLEPTIRPAKSEAIISTKRGLTYPAFNPQEPVPTPSPNAKPETAARTVQISLSTDADMLIENAEGKRFGFDFKNQKFVSEIPAARAIEREASTMFVLPFDKSGKPYSVTVSGKRASKEDADLSLTGPGFLVGFRGLLLKAGQFQKLGIASNGLHLSLTANQEGPTPQLFLTSQSGRDKPSYRFEVVSSLLETGKTITVDLDSSKGRLTFKTDAVKKDSFSVKMRRTNPGGTRDMFAHQNISFGKTNSYAMDFGQWDGKSDVCFYESCESCENGECTKLKNESGAR